MEQEQKKRRIEKEMAAEKRRKTIAAEHYHNDGMLATVTAVKVRNTTQHSRTPGMERGSKGREMAPTKGLEYGDRKNITKIRTFRRKKNRTIICI